MNDPQHLFLTGFRGTGKTSVGAILSRRLGCPLIDLDPLIEQRAGKSIRQIFQQGGESLFRDLESDVLSEVIERERSVISLGGGAILRESNRDLVRSAGICFWLDADADAIFQRLHGDATSSERRPPLTDLPPRDEIEALLDQRRSAYQAASDHRIDTAGLTPDQVAAEILELLAKQAG